MIISKEKYCIASKSFPLKFYTDGEEYDDIEAVRLESKEACEFDLTTFDEPEKYQILKVEVDYEF